MKRKPVSDRLDEVLSHAIISSMSEALIVLDEELRVLMANPAFYGQFKVTKAETENQFFKELGNGQWNIPKLNTLLEKLLPENGVVDRFEVEHDFPNLGKKIMVINGREVKYQDGNRKILLSIQDVTENRKLMRQKDMLLKEMRHRIANSLQLIASILILKADTVRSEESKLHLQDAYDRIISIATVQRNLDPTGDGDMVPVVAYLTTLCQSLAKSMIGGRKPISLAVNGSDGDATPDDAISMGLLTTELVINCLKHAFPGGEGDIKVNYHADKSGWKLTISDNGVGMPAPSPSNREGLGTNILASLAKQLDAEIERKSSSNGTIVSVIYRKRGRTS